MPAPALPPKIESLEPRKLMADTVSAAIDTSQTFQTVDAIGGAVNSGYQLPEYKKAAYYNQVFGDLGLTGVRSALDPGWELQNDNKDPNSINWAGFNDGAIANTMEYFAQAKARGVNTFLLSVWSPSAWMKTNKASRNGGQLRTDDREEFGEYVTAALLRARDKWGVTITQVSIGNEPWFTEPFPSTVWTPTQLAATIKVVARHIKAAGLTTQIVAPEDVSSVYRSLQYANAIHADPEADADVPILGTHFLSEQDRKTFVATATAQGKKVWDTEDGDAQPVADGAIRMAVVIDTAFSRAGVTGWFNWQISGTNPFEALMSSSSAGATPNLKYYVLRQFSHFVKPGFVRVGATYGSPGDSIRFSAFKDPATGNLSIVMTNDSTTDTPVNLSLTGGTLPASFEQVRTSATENGVRLDDVAGGPNVSVTLPAMSVVTLSSVPEPAPLANTTAAPNIPVPQYADAWNSNPLRQAAETGDLAKVQSLVEGGADVNAAFGNQWTPLFTAASSPYNKADQIVAYLLQHGADATHRDVEGMTALHVAAINQIAAFGTTIETAPARVQALLNAGIPVNALDGYGRTALIYAAMLPAEGPDLINSHADTGVLQALLAAGADPTIKDASGRTALDWAVAEHADAAIALLSQPGNIQADVFEDVNASGTHDAGDMPLAGVNVYVDLNNNDVPDFDEPTAVTDASGQATFTNLPVASYAVRAASPDATFTPAEALATVQVPSAATVTAALAFVPPTAPPPPPPPPPLVPPVGTAVLSGSVVNDKNANGKWDSGEGAIAGRTVYIDWNTNGVLDAGELTQTSSSTGKYTFTGLGAATYVVREVVPAGSTQTLPANGAGITVTLAAGATKNNLNFLSNKTAVVPPPPPSNGTASIHAYVINDTNKDGKWSGGEKGLAGRVVWLDADNDGVLDAGEQTATTASNGSFDFTTLAPGTYHVRQVLPNGWVQTSPPNNGPLTITLTANQVKSGNSLQTTTA